MKFTLSLSAACIGLACYLQSCAPALTVTSDYDKNADFGKYKTYIIDTLRIPAQMNQLNANRVLNAVKADLTKKGFSESNTPDMLVHIVFLAKEGQTVTSTSSYYGGYAYGGYYRHYYWGGPAGGMGYTTYDVQKYIDGSLIIDIADSQTKNLLWEGIGNKQIDGPADDPEKAINSAVTAIMASFPPKPAGDREPGQTPQSKPKTTCA